MMGAITVNTSLQFYFSFFGSKTPMEDWQVQGIKHPFASRIHCGKFPKRLRYQVSCQTGEPVSQLHKALPLVFRGESR